MRPMPPSSLLCKVFDVVIRPRKNLRGMSDTRPKIHSFNQRCPIQSRLQSVLGVRSFYVEHAKPWIYTEIKENVNNSNSILACWKRGRLWEVVAYESRSHRKVRLYQHVQLQGWPFPLTSTYDAMIIYFQRQQ